MANDTTASVASGEISFNRSNEISMEKEVLSINADRIKVVYSFLNTTAKPIKTTIAFPLPVWPYNSEPTWDTEFISNLISKGSVSTTYEEYIKHIPFLNFKVLVNGKEITYKMMNKAILPNGKDITPILRKHNIPLSRIILVGWEEAGLLESNPELNQKLKKLKLLDIAGKPLWSLQTIFYWEQIFPPKNITNISHSYTPASGNAWITKQEQHKLGQRSNSSSSKYEIRDRNKTYDLKDFCMRDEDLDRKVGSTFKRAFIVDYILSTGSNWKGPIKDFTLILEKNLGEPYTCFDESLKGNGTQYTVNIKDFTPREELKALFITDQQ
jgi:hypothetical protein